ncbi:TPA: hypothetical protein EYP44_03655 [Candidatus Bathyarchaeota archaeon]|nr:hypothetical protein [Candidatus Bathyarchaeota archaeon]
MKPITKVKMYLLVATLSIAVPILLVDERRLALWLLEIGVPDSVIDFFVWLNKRRLALWLLETYLGFSRDLASTCLNAGVLAGFVVFIVAVYATLRVILSQVRKPMEGGRPS